MKKFFICDLVFLLKKIGVWVGMEMGFNIFPVNADRCGCTVCYSRNVRNALNIIDCLSEEAKNIFTNDIVNVDPSTYTSLLRLSDNRILEEITDDNNYSSKFMIVLVVLMLLITICAIFLIIVYKGIIIVPGMSTEMMTNVVKCSGAVLGVAFFSCLFGLGYLTGCKVGSNDRRYKSVDAFDRFILTESAVHQKEGWDYLDKVHRELQAKSYSLTKDVIGAAYKNVDRNGDRFLRMRREFVHAGDEFSRLNERRMLVLATLSNLRCTKEELICEFNAVSNQNLSLREENATLRSKLDKEENN
ncbi:putative membrane protein [Candidatus Ichthyocystis hellenicum]|uniref:Putative membrane protein n=2 Tax=Candidatus Ichthyocystis hellenicum TaxID=1561003 RepID=A0A0S4M831_9BURK|nr:hypothetical protein [Candidatus Ichthyocystis hellenicum]CUT17540.1 putative membrane protein [Candidatus Ichthyocystis hellenicum]